MGQHQGRLVLVDPNANGLRPIAPNAAGSLRLIPVTEVPAQTRSTITTKRNDLNPPPPDQPGPLNNISPANEGQSPMARPITATQTRLDLFITRQLITGTPGADTLTGGSGNDLFSFIAGFASGDTVTDFLPAAGGGDLLSFTGYGTVAAGATFLQLNATDWQINAAGGGLSEVIHFTNAPAITPSDYHFV